MNKFIQPHFRSQLWSDSKPNELHNQHDYYPHHHHGDRVDHLQEERDKIISNANNAIKQHLAGLIKNKADQRLRYLNDEISNNDIIGNVGPIRFHQSLNEGSSAGQPRRRADLIRKRLADNSHQGHTSTNINIHDRLTTLEEPIVLDATINEVNSVNQQDDQIKSVLSNEERDSKSNELNIRLHNNNNNINDQHPQMHQLNTFENYESINEYRKQQQNLNHNRDLHYKSKKPMTTITSDGHKDLPSLKQQQIPSMPTFSQEHPMRINQSSLNHNNHQREQQTINLDSQSSVNATNNFLLATCLLLLAIIGLLLSHKWISRWFTMNKVTFKLYRRNIKNLLNLSKIPSNDKQDNNNNSNQLTKISTNNDHDIYSDNNESIQLVNRTPNRRFSQMKDNFDPSSSLIGVHGDAIIVDQSISVEPSCQHADSNCQNSNDDASEARVKTRARKHAKSIVISMKQKHHKFAQSNFITAVRQAGPKVSLFGAKVRRFIDDEAQELREKCQQIHHDGHEGSKINLRDRILGSILNPLINRIQNNNNNTNNDSNLSTNENNNNERSDDDKAQLSPEANHLVAQKLLRDLDADSENSVEFCKIDEQNNHLTAGNSMSTQQQQQSPDLSSIASVLIEQATNQQQGQLQIGLGPNNNDISIQTAASCACLKSVAKLRLSAEDGHNRTITLDEFNEKQRSKSQGHSPNNQCCALQHNANLGYDYQIAPRANNHAIIGNDNYMLNQQQQPIHLSGIHNSHQYLTSHSGSITALAKVRPCYSASPTTQHSNDFHSSNPQQNILNQAAGYYHNHQLCPFQTNSNNPYAPGALVSSSQQQNYHLKRQYENYYDDENSDPYHSLTASIGMELADLALSQHHHHHHHSPLAHQQQQAPNTSSLYKDPIVPQMNELINGFHHRQVAKSFNMPMAQASMVAMECMTDQNQDQQQQQQQQLMMLSNNNNEGLKISPCCQQQQHHQQTTIDLHPESYLNNNRANSFNNSRCATKGSSNAMDAGSAGELMLSSSASTSLGGSDNCFVHLGQIQHQNALIDGTNNNNSISCRENVCNCCRQIHTMPMTSNNNVQGKWNQFTSASASPNGGILPQVQLQPAPLVRPKSPGNSGPSPTLINNNNAAPASARGMPSPPMTILVQQPSLTSRSPSPSSCRLFKNGENNNNDESKIQLSDQIEKSRSNSIDKSASFQEKRDTNKQRQHHLARRISIAGDRISRAHNFAAPIGVARQDQQQLKPTCNERQQLASLAFQHGPMAMQHRASIASSDPQSGSHEMQAHLHQQIHHQHVMQPTINFATSDATNRFGQQNHNHQQQHLQQNNMLHGGVENSQIGVAEMSPVQQPMMILNQSSMFTANSHLFSSNSTQQHQQRNQVSSDCNSLCEMQPQIPLSSNYLPMYHTIHYQHQNNLAMQKASNSACSSSAGSTSGLGISASTGTACTNTPTGLQSFMSNYPSTSANCPFNWSAAAAAATFDYNSTPSSASTTNQYSQFQSLSSNYAASNNQGTRPTPSSATQETARILASNNKLMTPSMVAQHHAPRRSINPASSLYPRLMQSRKLSLPTHLESQSSSADYLAKADQCLNNRNQQQQLQHHVKPSRQSTIMSTTLSCTSGAIMDPHQVVAQEPIASSSQQAVEPGRRLSSQRVGDETNSRRSSQTITRQSSFWLEDNSLDSISSDNEAPKNQANNLEEDLSKSFELDLPIDDFNDHDEDDDDDDDDEDEDDYRQNKKASHRNAKGKKAAAGNSKHRGGAGRMSLARGGVFAKFSTSSSSSNAGQSPSPSPDLSKSRSRTLKATTSFKGARKNIPRLSLLATKANSDPTPALATATGAIAQLSGLPTACMAEAENSERDQTFSKLIESGSASAPAISSNEAPDEQVQKSNIKSEFKNESRCETSSRSTNQSCEPTNNSVASLDTDFSNANRPPNARPISDQNSGSLERQCRELWKLRATLHDDSCDLDDWSNYHQRLNKRYDSGYKSLEQQLSSSLEGGALLVQDQNAAPSQNQQQPAGVAPTTTIFDNAQQPERPKSGCSKLLLLDSQLSLQARNSQSQQNAKNNNNITDSTSLLDEQGLALMRKSPIEARSLRKKSPASPSIHEENEEFEDLMIEKNQSQNHSGRESKCSVLSEHAAKLHLIELEEQLELELELDEQQSSSLNCEERQHLLRNSPDNSMRDLVLAECRDLSRNSSRSSNEQAALGPQRDTTD